MSFYDEAASRERMVVEGMSGVGKTYFMRYLIWRLFHPDGVVVAGPVETVLLTRHLGGMQVGNCIISDTFTLFAP